MNIPEEGEFVESGTFRVDRERMLELLSRYQFQSPDMSLRALIRCAVASGASEVRIGRAAGGPGPGFELSFDGRPFAKEELLDLYSPLFDGGFSRGLHLAAGLLALQRTNPALISVSSGGASVGITGLLAHNPGPAVSGDRTVLRAFWEKDPEALPLARILDYPLRSDAALVCCPIPVRAPDGGSKPFSNLNSPSSPLCFEAAGRRGFVSPLEGDGSAAMSKVGIHAAGVYVETHTLRLPLGAVSADINDDGLTLDASFAHCVRDERFAEMLAFVEKQAGELLSREIKLQEKGLAEVGRQLRSRQAVSLWRERMFYLEDWEIVKSRSKSENFISRFWSWLNTADTEDTAGDDGRKPNCPAKKSGNLTLTASRTWWLRNVCRGALKDRSTPPDDEPLRSLWTAPVLLSTRGAALSLASVHERVVRGRLAVSKIVKGEALSVRDAVWLASFRDEHFLEEWIPRGAWDGDFL